MTAEVELSWLVQAPSTQIQSFLKPHIFFNLDLCVWGLQPHSTEWFHKDAVLLSGFTSFLWMERLICVKNTGFQKHLDLCRQGLRGMLPDKILKFQSTEMQFSTFCRGNHSLTNVIAESEFASFCNGHFSKMRHFSDISNFILGFKPNNLLIRSARDSYQSYQ